MSCGILCPTISPNQITNPSTSTPLPHPPPPPSMASFPWLTTLLHQYPEIIAAILCFILLHLNRRRSSVPTNWPVVGMLPALLSNIYRIHDFATDILESSGCTFLLKGPWFAGMDLLITSDPANINHIFMSNFSNYPKGDEFLEIFEILGNGIFNADHESWKAQRRMVHGLMAESRFRLYVVETSYDKVRRGIVPLLDEAAVTGEVLDLQDLFLRFTFDVTAILVMGVDPMCLCSGLPVVPFAKAIDDAEEVLLYRHIVPSFWWKMMKRMRIGEEKRIADARTTIDEFVEKHVQMKGEEMSKLREDPGTGTTIDGRRPDLFSSYLDGKKVEEKSGGIDIKSNTFLRDTAVNLMLAGRDTTASGLSWFFFLLSQNPHVESKILAEIRSVNRQYSDSNSEFQPEDLTSLTYLHAALCESLRLYPPVPFEHKAAIQPEILPSGHRVTPEMKILVSLYAMGRMEGVWGEDAREFKPERWISDRGRIRHEPSYKFMSFNSGPRTCLGKDIAFTQMKAVVVTLLRKYKVEVVDANLVVPKTSIILQMKNGMKVRVNKRD